MSVEPIRKKIAQNPSQIAKVDKVPTLLFPRKEVESSFYALLLGLAVILYLEKGTAEAVDQIPGEVASALASESGLSKRIEEAWSYLVEAGYWVPYYLISYGLEEGGKEGAFKKSEFYKQRCHLGFLILDALLLARNHILFEFGKGGSSS